VPFDGDWGVGFYDFIQDWESGAFVFDGEFNFPEITDPCSDSPWFPDQYGRHWKHLQTFFGLAIGDRDGNPTFPEIVEYMNTIHSGENFDWMLNTYDSNNCYESVMHSPELEVDYWIIKEFSSDGQGLTLDELNSFVAQGIFIHDVDSAVSHIMDVYSSDDDYINREELIQFFGDFMYADDVLTGKTPDAILDSWPYEGEIADAIASNPDSGFAKDGRPVELSDLVLNLSRHSGPDIMMLLPRYPFDHKWWNDTDLVVRYVVNSFVGEYDELNADSLANILDFVGVGPVDQDILEQVIEYYSEAGNHHFTHKE